MGHIPAAGRPHGAAPVPAEHVKSCPLCLLYKGKASELRISAQTVRRGGKERSETLPKKGKSVRMETGRRRGGKVRPRSRDAALPLGRVGNRAASKHHTSPLRDRHRGALRTPGPIALQTQGGRAQSCPTAGPRTPTRVCPVCKASAWKQHGKAAPTPGLPPPQPLPGVEGRRRRRPGTPCVPFHNVTAAAGHGTQHS